MKLRHVLRCALPLSLALAGCGGSEPMPVAAPMEPAPVVAGIPVLDRSLYSKDASGNLSEDDLQKVLQSPIDLAFPARIGVVPVARAFDAEGEVGIGLRATASRDFAERLRGFPEFSHVSDVSTELPNVGGIEGLRAIAARYRLRYLLLYSEKIVDDTHANGWVALYPTLIGMFIAPGVTVESYGLLQADLVDVRTGTVLFSVVEPMHVESDTLMVGAARTHREEQALEATAAAGRLAKRVKIQANELVAFADDSARDRGERRARIVPAPVDTTIVPTAAPPAATVQPAASNPTNASTHRGARDM